MKPVEEWEPRMRWWPSCSLLLLVAGCASPSAVPDDATANKIGSEALKAKLGEDAYIKMMVNEEWKATLQGDVWNAEPFLKPEADQTPCGPNPRECVRVQTGGWSVYVSRKDGRVINIIQEH